MSSLQADVSSKEIYVKKPCLTIACIQCGNLNTCKDANGKDQIICGLGGRPLTDKDTCEGINPKLLKTTRT